MYVFLLNLCVNNFSTFVPYKMLFQLKNCWNTGQQNQYYSLHWSFHWPAAAAYLVVYLGCTCSIYWHDIVHTLMQAPSASNFYQYKHRYCIPVGTFTFLLQLRVISFYTELWWIIESLEPPLLLRCWVFCVNSSLVYDWIGQIEGSSKWLSSLETCETYRQLVYWQRYWILISSVF